MSTPTADQQLTALYDACAHRVLAYCLRHVDPVAAEDVLAETFAIAWRRLDRVPVDRDRPEDGLPWLITVARNLIRNGRRSAQRQQELLTRMREVTASCQPGVDHEVAERDTLLVALSRLTDREREALLLTAWDGLDVEAAARVTGCSARAFRARVTRARARLREESATERSNPETSATTRAHQTTRTPAGDRR